MQAGVPSSTSCVARIRNYKKSRSWPWLVAPPRGSVGFMFLKFVIFSLTDFPRCVHFRSSVNTFAPKWGLRRYHLQDRDGSWLWPAQHGHRFWRLPDDWGTCWGLLWTPDFNPAEPAAKNNLEFFFPGQFV